MPILDDSSLSITNFSSICSLCERFKKRTEWRTCPAFPDKIPDAIWEGDNDHTQPVDGDHGLQFVKAVSYPRLKRLGFKG